MEKALFARECDVLVTAACPAPSPHDAAPAPPADAACPHMPLLCLSASSQPQLLSPALLPTPVQLMCKRLFSCSPFQLRLLPCRLSPLPLLLLCPGRQSIPSASSCAPSHTSAQPPPSCLQRLWRRLSSCPPFQLHLLSCRPSPLPSLLLCLDRQPNPSTSLCTPSHTSTQPPPSRLQRLVWKRLCSWEPFQLGLLSHRPSPLPSLLPCRDRQPIPPAFSRLPLPTFTQSPPPRLLYRHSPLCQRPPRHVSSGSPAGAVSLSRACLDPPRRKSPYSSGLYKSRLVRTSCPKVWRPSARAPCLF